MELINFFIDTVNYNFPVYCSVFRANEPQTIQDFIENDILKLNARGKIFYKLKKDIFGPVPEYFSYSGNKLIEFNKSRDEEFEQCQISSVTKIWDDFNRVDFILEI